MFESRTFNLLMAFVCHELLISAFYFQYVDGMEPCPLCIFQRVAVFILGLWFLINGIHKPLAGSRWNLFYDFGALFTGLVGAGISARHAYLQSLPAGEVPACGPSLDYLVDMLPFAEMLDVVLKGSGECAEVSWRMLGMTMPLWLLLFFIGCLGIVIWRIYRHFNPSRRAFG
jgi:protein dithiol:quinone oxidoreductase